MLASMARLRDVPHVLRTVGPIAFGRRVWKQGSEDELMTWASALAYSWLFAIFPFFIFLMTFIPHLPEGTKDTIRHELEQLVRLFPKDMADTLWTNVQTQVLDAPTGKGWLRGTGLLLALWAASSGMATTMTALDRCYELRVSRSYIRHRLAAATMTIVVATLILLVVLLLPIGGIVKEWIVRHDWPGLQRGSPWMIAFDIARWVLALGLLVGVLTVLYHWGPYVRHRFHWLTPGSVFCIVVWIGLGLAFKVYFGRFASFNKTYGTVGGVAVMLMVFYIDAAVLLWGAEINSEMDFEMLKIKRGTRDFIPAEKAVEAGPVDLFETIPAPGGNPDDAKA